MTDTDTDTDLDQSDEAIAKAFRHHSGVSCWTRDELEPFSLSRSLADGLRDYFGPIMLCRRASPSTTDWSMAEELKIQPDTSSRDSGPTDQANLRSLRKEGSAIDPTSSQRQVIVSLTRAQRQYEPRC